MKSFLQYKSSDDPRAYYSGSTGWPTRDKTYSFSEVSTKYAFCVDGNSEHFRTLFTMLKSEVEK